MKRLMLISLGLKQNILRNYGVHTYYRPFTGEYPSRRNALCMISGF
jgi:hypothetical protein